MDIGWANGFLPEGTDHCLTQLMLTHHAKDPVEVPHGMHIQLRLYV